MTKLTEEQSDLIEDNFLAIMDIAGKFRRGYEQLLQRKKIDKQDVEQIALEQACKLALKLDQIEYGFTNYLYSTLHFSIKRVVETDNIVKIPRRDNWDGDCYKDDIESIDRISKGLIVELDKPRANEECEEETTLFNMLDGDGFDKNNQENNFNKSIREEFLVELVGEDMAQAFVLQSKGFEVGEIAKNMGMTRSAIYGRMHKARKKIRDGYNEHTLFEGISG